VIWLKVPPPFAGAVTQRHGELLNAAMSLGYQGQTLNANLRPLMRMVQESVAVQASSQHTSVCLAFTALEAANTPTALHLALACPGLGQGWFLLAVRRDDDERRLLDNPVYLRDLRLAGRALHARHG
jgi:hypothetical protein